MQISAHIFCTLQQLFGFDDRYDDHDGVLNIGSLGNLA